MKALLKTLIGDWVNLSFVTVVIAVELGLIHLGYAPEADLVVPLLIMGGVSWLATR